MSTSEKHPAPRPAAVVAWDPVDAAVRAAAASGDRTRIALLRLLAEACEAVDPIPTLRMADFVSWSTDGGDAETFGITIEAPRHRISGWIEADVRVRADDATLDRFGLTRDDALRDAMLLRTRIPLGPEVREHVTERTIPILGAYAHACADVLDGSAAAMDERELDVALDLLVRDAHARHIAVPGNDPDGRWSADPREVLLRHRGETPLEPGSASMAIGLERVEIDAPGIPPFAAMTVDDEGTVVIRRSERGSFLAIDPGEEDPLTTLRAVARLREIIGKSGE